MRAQIVLKPADSKRLIAKALVEMDAVQKALRDGIVMIHPSSTTYHMVELLTGRKPEGVWLAGMLSQKGACVEGRLQKVIEDDQYREHGDPGNFSYSWLFRKGKFETGVKLSSVLAEMRESDVYIKGVNAIDAHGYVGVLIGNVVSGGTIGKVRKAERERKFRVIYTGGLEKFIPGSLMETAKDSGRPNTSDAMGMACGLLPIQVQAFTEIEALKILAHVEVIPMAAGGVGGAEGSVVFIIKGEDADVKRAMQVAMEAKNSKLPSVIVPVCKTCHWPGCYYSGKEMD